ncbi:SusC/RagA family TonB-linked outer membrane protein [Flavobacterium bizetiae]|uniref:SusC/RagA family TonB-linked outer membrane protein n=1 Tax=Flavobacterium bizetiae TaxID=2704140 RepID=UPI00375736D4
MKIISLNKGLGTLWYPLILGLYLCCTPAQANNRLRQNQFQREQNQISGTITDGTSPLPGVTISIKGKRNNTVSSDFNGQYILSATATDTLMVSFIGFKTAIVPLNGRKIVNIQLQEDLTTLKEVRVNAGYYTVKESERTGSIAKIKAADIEKQPVNNVLAAMQGRMAGVNITQNTGLPGGGFNIQIRGVNSIRTGGNDPLYIVDGVPYGSQSLVTTSLANGILPGTISPLNNINPNDIEGIEVLKDADATAIYGSRGANGVVLITTKKGKTGATHFNINTATTIGKIARKMDLMNTQQYLAMRREGFANDEILEYPDYEYDVNGTWSQTRDTDWQKELLGGTAHISNTQASVSGGSENTQFLLSGTYRRETTVFPGDAHYDKGALHSSMTHLSADHKFKLSFSADYVADKNTLPGIDLTNAAYNLPPNAPELYDASGKLNWENGTFENPLAYLESTFLATTQNLISNIVLSYKLAPSWEFRTSLGYNDMHLSESLTSPSTMFNPAYGAGPEYSALSISSAKRNSWIIEPQLNWSKKWGGFELNALTGTTFQMQKSQQLSQNGAGFVSNSLINDLAAAARLSIVNHEMSEYKYNAVYGRINLNLKDRYILNFTGRRDGSSRFGPGNRFANFGAVGTTWIFSKENFLSAIPSISFGKLRASYGTSGNDQIGDYQFLDAYQVSGQNYNGIIGIKPARLFNPDFGWEVNRKFEVAMEMGFFSDGIFLTLAYFRNRSSNQLVGIPLPATTGFTSLQANLDATVQNKGIEVELRAINFKKSDFKWISTINVTIPENKLLTFPNLAGSTYANTLVIGQSLNARKVYHYIGINPETGTYTFEDYNGDGKIASNDRQYVVDTAPKYFGGLSNQLTYKNWAFDCLFQFVKQLGGNYLTSSGFAGVMANQPVEVLSHWPQDGVGAATQLYTSGSNNDAVIAASRYSNSSEAFTDASFIRLKSVSLSYQLPTEWSKSFSGKLYLQGQNIFTMTNYKGADPENHSGLFLPPLRQYTLGFQISF